jgi:hypothetical protein
MSVGQFASLNDCGGRRITKVRLPTPFSPDLEALGSGARPNRIRAVPKTISPVLGSSVHVDAGSATPSTHAEAAREAAAPKSLEPLNAKKR